MLILCIFIFSFTLTFIFITFYEKKNAYNSIHNFYTFSYNQYDLKCPYPWTLLESQWTWIAMDKNGILWAYNRKPIKDKQEGSWEFSHKHWHGKSKILKAYNMNFDDWEKRIWERPKKYKKENIMDILEKQYKN